MDKRIITHVFAAVQSLEKCLSKTKELLPEAGPEAAEERRALELLVPQQEEALLKMRRTANRLQMEMARSDWNSATRSLRIFYGLNHLIRRDVLKSHSKLAGTPSRYLVTETKAEAKQVVH